MARALRKWFPGATYHIMARGNHRQPIIRDEIDCSVFVELLSQMQSRSCMVLHAYCLMTNHYHLLIETSQEPLWMSLKRFNQCYAAYFNAKYGLCGHLYQGRYKSCLVENDAYFLQTSRYIHLNPVAAGITLMPQEYTWSSYRSYLGLQRLAFVSTAKTLDYFQPNKILRYQDFVEGPSLVNTRALLVLYKEMGEEQEQWLPW